VESERAVYAGEIDRRGFLVPEQYLDDRSSGRIANRLKMWSRCHSLPLIARVGRQRGWPEDQFGCMSCKSGETEDSLHFFFRCEAHADLTADLHRSVAHLLHNQGFSTNVEDFWALGEEMRLRIFLGRQVDCSTVESAIDLVTKTFLRKAWNRRRPLCSLLNNLFSRGDATVAAPGAAAAC
jgi:hypothetical protein